MQRGTRGRGDVKELGDKYDQMHYMCDNIMKHINHEHV